jgi:predicted small lipoprotein YifL
MIKKISLILVLFIVIFSCGKKGDPIYKESKKNLFFETILINKT